jgi:hypothetical protein
LTIFKLLSLLKGNMLAQLTNVTAAKYGPKKPEIMRPCKIWEFVDGNRRDFPALSRRQCGAS